ncbi:carbohydrate ABC transporter permease [Chitinilyticum aquatile]|uniref:carbohydrate ABC transporter permease n=1 Tax=Chitinilyticum aquatile TaxID=362520 RepID=UPI001FDF29A4|nr:sugar ABC transporter permease [Chitinilyticum aquatile]
MASPFLLFFAVFTVWPLLFNGWLAFHDFHLRTGNTLWNGFANFVALAEDDSTFHPAVKNSALFLLTVPVIQICALALALLLNPDKPLLGTFRVLFYTPVVIAISIGALVWRQILMPDGMLTWIGATLLGVDMQQMPDWLNDQRTALWSVMAFFCWKHIGYYMVLYLAGLQAVPKTLLEAATLDGANYGMRLRHVVFPAIQPVILLSTLLCTISALRAFQEILVMTGGDADTQTVPLYVFGAAIFGLNFGVAAAAALLLTLVCLGLAWLQWKWLGEDGLLRRGL